MDRRNFIRLCCGGFGLASLFTLLKTGKAQAKPLKVYAGELKTVPGYVVYDTVEVHPDGSTTNLVYTFLKGPRFTNIEEAYEVIQRCIDKDGIHFPHIILNQVVTLESITKETEKGLTIQKFRV